MRKKMQEIAKTQPHIIPKLCVIQEKLNAQCSMEHEINICFINMLNFLAPELLFLNPTLSHFDRSPIPFETMEMAFESLEYHKFYKLLQIRECAKDHEVLKMTMVCFENLSLQKCKDIYDAVSVCPGWLRKICESLNRCSFVNWDDFIDEILIKIKEVNHSANKPYAYYDDLFARAADELVTKYAKGHNTKVALKTHHVAVGDEAVEASKVSLVSEVEQQLHSITLGAATPQASVGAAIVPAEDIVSTVKSTGEESDFNLDFDLC